MTQKEMTWYSVSGPAHQDDALSHSSSTMSVRDATISLYDHMNQPSEAVSQPSIKCFLLRAALITVSLQKQNSN